MGSRIDPKKNFLRSSHSCPRVGKEKPHTLLQRGTSLSREKGGHKGENSVADAVSFCFFLYLPPAWKVLLDARKVPKIVSFGGGHVFLFLPCRRSALFSACCRLAPVRSECFVGLQLESKDGPHFSTKRPKKSFLRSSHCCPAPRRNLPQPLGRPKFRLW